MFVSVEKYNDPETNSGTSRLTLESQTNLVHFWLNIKRTDERLSLQNNTLRSTVVLKSNGATQRFQNCCQELENRILQGAILKCKFNKYWKKPFWLVLKLPRETLNLTYFFNFRSNATRFIHTLDGCDRIRLYERCIMF